MQIWNGIETEPGVQFDQIQSKLFPHHLPNSCPAGNRIPDHCPRILSPWDSPLSRCPVDSQIWQPRPPPTLLSPPPFFLVTPPWWQLYARCPQGGGERPDLHPEFGRTVIPSISFALSPCFSINRRVSPGKNFCNQRLVFARLLAPTKWIRTVPINHKILFSFIWSWPLNPSEQWTWSGLASMHCNGGNNHRDSFIG